MSKCHNHKSNYIDHINKNQYNLKKYNKYPDLIIIGAGTAGLPAAWALTNKKNGLKSVESLYSVLVIEAGENHNDDPIVNDPTLNSSQFLTFNPKYAYNPVTLNGEVYSEGRGIGGSSMHNGIQAVRGTPEIYNKWAEITHNPRWRYSNLLPLFKNQEKYTPNGTQANPGQRGFSGRLFITQEPPLVDEFSKAMAEGLKVPMIEDYNDHYKQDRDSYANTVGVSANQDWITPPPNSRRSYSGNSYLYGIPEFGIPPIVDERGIGINGRELKVITSGTVSKILFEGNRAIGVEVVRLLNGVRQVKRYYSNKGVILSAGTIGSARLLQLSGIGDRTLLESLGINVLLNNPNVGANIQNHYGPQSLIRLVNPNSPPPSFKLNVAFGDLYPYLQIKGAREVQIDFIHPGNIFFDPSIITTLELQDIPSVSVSALLLQSSSRGNVKIQSADPLTPPLLDLGHFNDVTGNTGIAPWGVTGSDAYKAVSYLKLVQDIAVAQGGGPQDVLFPPNNAYPAPWGPAHDDSKLFDITKNNVFFSYHCVGSCRMGTSRANGVVDGDLKVFGVNGLWIADCSVEPIIQTGNTAYMAYFIGLQLAKILGADLP